MITAAQQLTFGQSAAQQWLIVCLLVGIFTVVGWIVRGAVSGVWVLYLLARELRAAHRRGVARVRAYEAETRPVIGGVRDDGPPGVQRQRAVPVGAVRDERGVPDQPAERDAGRPRADPGAVPVPALRRLSLDGGEGA